MSSMIRGENVILGASVGAFADFDRYIVLGVRPGVLDAAERIRAAGHEVVGSINTTAVCSMITTRPALRSRSPRPMLLAVLG